MGGHNKIMRTCSTCKQEKIIDCFGKTKKSKDGIMKQCKDCVNKRARLASARRREENVELHKNLDIFNTFKMCTYCNSEKCLNDFQKEKSCRDSRDSLCKECANKILRDKRACIIENSTYIKTGTRICSMCNEELNIEEFYIEAGGVGGRRAECRCCRQVKKQDTINNNRRQRNIAYFNRRAKSINSNFRTRNNLSLGSTEYYEVQGHEIMDIFMSQNGKCYYCGVELGDLFHYDHKISVNNNGINEPSNLAVCCKHCNEFKSAMNEDEFKSFLKEYSERLNLLFSSQC